MMIHVFHVILALLLGDSGGGSDDNISVEGILLFIVCLLFPVGILAATAWLIYFVFVAPFSR